MFLDLNPFRNDLYVCANPAAYIVQFFIGHLGTGLGVR